MRTRDFDLVAWQSGAVDAWEQGSNGTGRRGTLEIFTGGGKTLIALRCIARLVTEHPGTHTIVVVPTEALARQWQTSFHRYTDIDQEQVGLLGAGKRDDPLVKQVLIAVINSAAKHLPGILTEQDPHRFMLVVDECHRAGAPTFSDALRVPARFRLGLSATPDRDEVDENGEVIPYEEQVVGRLLGPVVYRFTLKDARQHGWLPDYLIHHQAVTLQTSERKQYDTMTRRIDDLTDVLEGYGIDPIRARSVTGLPEDTATAATAWMALTARRKDLLYHAEERTRVATHLVTDALEANAQSRILLFHERVDEAASLAERLHEKLPTIGIGLEHSKLPTSQRSAVLADFREGRIAVLVSVKALVEGIDVPDADVGISVASSSSVRQRIQSLGRVLRRGDPAKPSKTAAMHVVYVADTVDDLIYRKEDWSDLTGPDTNRYWIWPSDPSAPPTELDGPPHKPTPSEPQEHERLRTEEHTLPSRWYGSWPSAEYSIDTRGTVRDRSDNVIENPQDVHTLIASVRPRFSGRFAVTPRYRYVLVRADTPPRDLMVVGTLEEPFERVADRPFEVQFDTTALRPGDEYPGTSEESGGEYRLAAKRGGVIQRRTLNGIEFALTADTDDPELEANAVAVLKAWRSLAIGGMKFFVNAADDAVYWDAGSLKFLAHIPNGFAWPTRTLDMNG